jgi:hypothetical protein
MQTNFSDGRVVFVDRTDASDGPIAHGRDAFHDSVANAGGSVDVVSHWQWAGDAPVVVAGLADEGVVGRLLADGADRDPDLTGDEGVVFRWVETDKRGTDSDPRTVLVAAGTDETGLMYALLELAERVAADSPGALNDVENAVTFPDNRIRGVDRFVAGPADEWLFDESFWESFLDRLAAARFNRLVLVTGYDTAYLGPPYPYMVDVPGYPDVAVQDDPFPGGSVPDRAAHRRLFQDIAERCHERGIEFLFGIWQQQPWSDRQARVVTGLPDDADDLAGYCAAGLQELLVELPEVDGVQFRVNYESGVGDRTSAEAFWRSLMDATAAAEAKRDRPLELDVRAKGLSDGLIAHAEELGPDLVVPTKFWCESTGLPYHNTRMREDELSNLADLNKARRYGYADLLREPRGFDLLYRLWVMGTNRVFVWGDPDYARRFSRAAGFGGAAGFEVTTPLCMKGGHAAIGERYPLHADPDLRHYDWEDDRYWAWYRAFGRFGYDADADPAVWERPFRERFGGAADPIRRGYAAASAVLPILTAWHLPHHPAQHTWQEMTTGGALFAEHNHDSVFPVSYRTAEPSDPGLFAPVDEYVAGVLADDREPGRFTPMQVAAWFDRLASETCDAVNDAEAEVPAGDRCAELRATVVDLRMLADLATYHAAKIRAAVALEFHERTSEVNDLRTSHAHMRAAREAWESLADRGDVYHDDLVFAHGADTENDGTWADRLPELDADLAELERRLDDAGIDPADSALGAVDAGSQTTQWAGPTADVPIEPGPDGPARAGADPIPGTLSLPETCPADRDLSIEVTTDGLGDLDTDSATLHYRRTNHHEGSFRTATMVRTESGYRGTVPAAYLDPSWDLLVYVSARDAAGNTRLLPGIFAAEDPAPYRVVDIEAPSD